MAHFAQLKDNVVQKVIVVSNWVLEDKEFPESESIGITFCKSLYGEDTEWRQTSYNSNFRGKFAGIGNFYDSVLDIFTTPTVEETITE